MDSSIFHFWKRICLDSSCDCENIMVQVKIIGSYGGRARQDLPKLVKLAESGIFNLSAAVSRTCRIEDANEVYQDLNRGSIIGRAVVEIMWAHMFVRPLSTVCCYSTEINLKRYLFIQGEPKFLCNNVLLCDFTNSISFLNCKWRCRDCIGNNILFHLCTKASCCNLLCIYTFAVITSITRSSPKSLITTIFPTDAFTNWSPVPPS